MIDNKYIYEIDSDNVKEIMHSNSINDERKIYSLYTKNNIESNVTIIVQAYNRIEKTKKCISSILKYTSDVDYDLLLIDNGSTDNTFDYFKSVNCIKKRIIHLSKNISVTYPTLFYDLSWLSRYVVVVQNDLIVTPHWLSNLIKVAESDDRIGMVNPVSSNVSNFQQVELLSHIINLNRSSGRKELDLLL